MSRSDQPWDLKTRAANIIEAVVTTDSKARESAIRRLESEGFPDAATEIARYTSALYDDKHKDHQGVVAIMAEMYRVREDG
jgi:hypothetical protein